MFAITVLSIGVFFIALLVLVTVQFTRENRQHIEDVACGRTQPDDWFWMLLDDPDYLDYYRICLGLAEIKRQEKLEETQLPTKKQTN